MKIFTVQNLIVFIASIVVFILLTTLFFSVHKRFLKKIKTWQAANFYRCNVDHQVINVEDNRNRVFVAKEGMTMNIDPTISYKNQLYGRDKNLTLLTFVPKNKPLVSRRVIRTIISIVFTLTVVITFLSASLLFSDFFEKDILDILNVRYTRSFWLFIKNYDVLFISFSLNLFCFIMNRMLSDTIITFRKYEIAYINMLNYQQMNITYSPVIVKID